MSAPLIAIAHTGEYTLPVSRAPAARRPPVAQYDVRQNSPPMNAAEPATGPIDYNASPLSKTSYRLQPSRGWVAIPFREMWDYRELLFFLTWRDIVVRYKQTLLGVAWAIIQPFTTMVVFSIFFGGLAGVPSGGIPYPIFSFAALVPWTFFANGLSASSNSLVGSANLLKKVYFPRLIIPVSSVLSGFPDFALSFLVLLAMMLIYGLYPSLASILWLPFFLVLALITALGVGLWLSALNVQYRDVRYVVPFLVQIWLFATPVAYASSMLEEPWRTLYGLNPMVGVVEGFRWVLLSNSASSPFAALGLERLGFHLAPMGAGSPPGPMVIISAVVALVLLFSGALYFRRTEKTFADVV